MNRLIFRVTFLLSSILLGATLSLGQTPSEPPKPQPPSEPQKLPDKFAALRDTRARLLKEIPILERQLEELKFRERQVRVLTRDLDRAKTDLERVKAEKPVNKLRVESIEDFIRRIEADVKEGSEAPKLIKPKEQELTQKTKELAEVEDKIDELLNPEIAKQTFKTRISVYFTVLVGLVIVGFFFIAYWDDKVRQAIFSGQAGIQFLTLFSLVIAIILFGITGILEGKELAALLGGISGYILGKVP